MDAETSMKNDSFQVEELAAHDITIEESDMGNQEAVQKVIKKYQNKVNEMLKIIQKQKKQNEGLKAELKGLNESLNNVIGKLSTKNIKQHSPEPPKDEVLKKELENEIKKNVNLLKEVTQLRVRVKGLDSTRVAELQNELKQKDRKIDELTVSLKTYEKMEKQEKNMDIYKKEQELASRVTALNEEILHLRGKLAKQKKNEEMQEKMMKRQHEQILTLEAKTKTDESARATNTANLAKSPAKIASSRPAAKNGSADKLAYLKEKYEKEDVGKNPSEKKYLDKIHELEDKCENLDVTKKTTEKHLRHEIEGLKQKIKSLEAELEESRNVVKRKDKEANILVSKMKETQRKNYNTLEPVEKMKYTEEFGSTGLFDQRKEFRGLVHVQGSFRKFDDTEDLSLEKNYRIKSFIFTWFEEHILSLDTVYELKNGSVKEVSSFKIKHGYKNIREGGLELSDYEYIKEVDLYCGKAVEFLKIQTSRDRVLEVGNEKNRVKCKQFSFDIRNNEKPIAFLGAIDTKKVVGVEGTRELLISFGLEIKKKDVVGKSKFNSSRANSMAKQSSKSALENPRYNDKNVIQEE